jgi:hypothetical protein
MYKEKEVNKNVKNIFLSMRDVKFSEQFYKGKAKTHKYIKRQNQSTTGKL